MFPGQAPVFNASKLVCIATSKRAPVVRAAKLRIEGLRTIANEIIQVLLRKLLFAH